MLGMMNCQTENYEFYASPPSSSAPQLRQDGNGQQQTVEGLEAFSSRKQKKAQISYTADGRRLIDGKMGEESRQEPAKLWNRVIVDNLTTRRLRRERSNRKEDEEVTEEGDEQLEHEEKERERQKQENEEEETKEEETMEMRRKQKHKASFSGILSKLKPRKKSHQQHKTTENNN